jgi:hypothetical protein
MTTSNTEQEEDESKRKAKEEQKVSIQISMSILQDQRESRFFKSELEGKNIKYCKVNDKNDKSPLVFEIGKSLFIAKERVSDYQHSGVRNGEKADS